MDRSKAPRTKGSKPSHLPFPGSGELIALGKTSRPESEARSSSKTTTTSSSSSTRSPSSIPSSSTKSAGSSAGSSSSSGKSSDKKRESASSPQSGPPKKVRLHAASSSSSSSPVPTGGSSTSFPSVPSLKSSSSFSSLKLSGKSTKRESDEFEISPQDLTCDQFFAKLEKAEKTGVQNLQPLMLTALKRLRSQREKPEIKLCSGLMSAAQAHPQWFQHPSIVETIFLTMSRKKAGADVKAKLLQNGSPLPPFLICLLAHAYGNVQPWPIEFFQMWVEDACGDRIWVDRPQCKPFVDNIMSSFETILPAASLLQPIADPTPLASGSSSPLGSMGDIDPALMDDIIEVCEVSPKVKVSVSNRCPSTSQLESTVLDHTREVIHKKSPDIPRNVLRVLTAASGLPGVRAFSILKLELWIHIQKCSRQAQELLLYLCVNAKAEVDNDLIIAITKLRLKTKPLIHFFANCVKEMARTSEGNLRSILNFVLANELTSQRHPSNLQMLSAIMMNLPNASSILAEIYCDVLQKREDQLGALRPVLREIVRTSRFEIELKTFVDGLVQLREIQWRDGDVRDRTFMAITDLIVLCMFLLVSPTVRESAVLKGDSKDMSTMDVFHSVVADIQEAGIYWLYSIVPRMFRPGKKEFAIALNKILLRDPLNDLVSKDGWPPEPERSLFARLCLDVPLKENILMWTLLMGVSKEHPLNQPEILELVEFLILRAASHKSISCLQKPEILSCLFRLCEYKHPENISLPLGYEPPKLAISKLYWKVWLLLCIISAYNPVTFGKMGWETYPTLKILMEMCMTNHFSYPTVASSETAEELHLKEMQISALEKAEILEFEQHLAAASSKQTITERNSLLLPQLIRMDPFGSPRLPPSSMLAQLKSLNEQMRLGHHFCRSRSPDFLLHLIQRNSQPMPWLSELVSEGPVEILPVQCLCELMLGQTDKITKALASHSSEATLQEKGGKKHKSPEDTKSLQLLQHLQKSIHDSESDDNAKEILEYFFRKLSSPKSSSRNQALQSLQMLLPNSSSSDQDDNWLLDSLPALPFFREIQGLSTALLRQAIQVENEPEWILRYLEFLTSWSHLHETEAEMDNLALDVAQLVVERNGVISALLGRHPKAYDALFEIFLNYMKKIREPHKETYKWSESQDQVLVQWPIDRLEATMNILVIHAIVILLTSYSAATSVPTSLRQSEAKKLKTGKGKSVVELKYNDLQDMWFPKTKEACPKGYLLNTSEEAVLFPDWIKLRMIRSNNARLLESALQDLEADQLVLFVQSFGVPTKSMSALLYSLDKAVEQNADRVTSAIGDAQYMNTLVELQLKRGANGGEKFSSLLKTVTGFEELMDMSASKSTSKQYVVRPPMPEALTKIPHTSSIKKENLASNLRTVTLREVSPPKQSIFKNPKKDTVLLTDYMPKTCEKIREIALNDDLSTAMDSVSFNLITSVAHTQSGKDWAKKATYETETFLRKIADVHPVLLLRQLPLMGSLLEGRVHLDFAIFHAQNHHIPFNVYLGLWELMQPHIISTQHFTVLKDTFFLYMKLFENYGHLKDYSANVRRFSILLHNFWLNDKDQVKEFLEPHRSMLTDLATVKYYVDVTPLQNLIKVAFPPDELMPASIENNSSTYLMDSVISLVERMQHAYSNHDDMVPILLEIDSMSNRDPSILNHFGDKLKPLLLSHHEVCRTLSISLILKHVTYSPRSEKFYFLYIMEALEVKDAHLRDAVLERIHEHIILGQEHAVEILNKLFDLGVNSFANTLPAITKTTGILRAYTGL